MDKVNKKKILIFTTISLVVLSLSTFEKNIRIPIVSDALGVIVSPIQNLATTTMNLFDDMLKFFNDKNELLKEIEILEAENSKLIAENKTLILQQQENETLNGLLNLNQKFANLETTGSHIIAKDPGNWYDTFLIDKGTVDGIDDNMPLISSGGLVGKITESSLTHSKALSILDIRSNVSAMSLRTGDLGIVKGDYLYKDLGLCVMEYIDGDAEILEGDEIITSNISTTYPQGITIGYVKEIKIHTNGLTKFAIIEPQVDFKHLDTLLIVTKHSEGS